MSIVWRRRLAFVIFISLVAVGLIWAFRPEPVPVDLAAAARGPMVVTAGDEGISRVREVYVVSAPLAGRVLRIGSDAGDEVTGGETVVATILPTAPGFLDVRSRAEAEAAVEVAEAALELAEAKVRSAEVELAFARNEFDRVSRLAERGVTAARNLDQAQMDVQVREAALATARADVQVEHRRTASARARLIEPTTAAAIEAGTCCVQIRAPVSGRILRVLQKSESVVAAGTPLFEIGDLADLEVAVDLLSTDAVQVEVGAPAWVENWGGVRLPGRVRRIEPSGFTAVSALGVKEQRVTVLIDLLETDAAAVRLGHGYRVDVAIATWQGEDVLTIPLSALFRDGNDWAVFVVADGIARLRRVEIGHMNGEVAEVHGGLEAGEDVVLHASDRVADGVAITPRSQG